MTENATRLKAALLALGILVVGVILGATAHRWVPAVGDRQAHKPPPERPRIPQPGATSERLLKRYSRNLDLTDVQQTEIDQILDQSRELMVEVRKNIGSKIETVRRDTWAKIRDVLTPGQQEIFDELTSPVSPNIILRQFKRRLDLNEDQQAEISRILKSNWAEMRRMRRKIRERLKEIHKDSRAEQLNLLTPEQRKQAKGRWNPNLSGEQRTEMDRIRRESRETTRRLFQERDEQLGLAVRKTWLEVKTHLDSSQVAKFHRITDGIERRMKWERQSRRRPGGRPTRF